jgi:hypothetical protein
VTSVNGIALDSVEVLLYYNYEYVQSTPIDTHQIVIDNPAKVLFVAVYDIDNKFIRELFFGFRPVGVMPRFFWDERNDSNKIVPSGLYFIKYVYDTATVKEDTWIVEGHLTVTTNSRGLFTIPNKNLPVGRLVDIYQNDRYFETDSILPRVNLVFQKSDLISNYSIMLEKNKITNGTFILQ